MRGKGSGHLEGPNNVESADPLMCCVSCPTPEDYEEAKKRVRGKPHNTGAVEPS